MSKNIRRILFQGLCKAAFLLSLILLPGEISHARSAVEGRDTLFRKDWGISVALLGDSITWLGGDDCSGERGWSRYFLEEMGSKVASCRSFARSGATWTNTPSTKRDINSVSEVLDCNNVIYNQVCRLIGEVESGSMSSPDVVMIAAGINDAWFQKSRPGALSQTPGDVFSINTDRFITDTPPHEVLSIAYAVRFNCELLMEAFPDSQIVLLTPSQCTKVPFETVSEVSDIIEGCAARMALGVIRLDRCGSLYSVREAVASHSTYDGVHTSPEGARRNGVMIANALRSMLQK